MHIALMLNNVVQNIIVSDSLAFADELKQIPGYPTVFDTAVVVDGIPNVQIGSVYNGSSFSAPAPSSVSPTIAEQLDAGAFGAQLMARFALENTARGLNASQKYQLAQNLSGVATLLMSGDLETVLAILPSLPVDGVLLTEAIINQFTSSIQSYLNS